MLLWWGNDLQWARGTSAPGSTVTTFSSAIKYPNGSFCLANSIGCSRTATASNTQICSGVAYYEGTFRAVIAANNSTTSTWTVYIISVGF